MQTIGVVFNLSPKIEYVECGADIKCGEFCIVNSTRGEEFAKVVQVDAKNRGELSFLRKATERDIEKNKENLAKAEVDKKRVKEIVAKQFDLNMKVCKCEYTFDQEKLIIHYTAEGRVDFRELVKVLAGEFKARIEMHQISSREETQIMGAIGCCGRICCCKNHLSDFDKVSIKMAKKQGLSLNPQKLNGMCGKLLCCLRYENDFYEEACKRMPKVGEKISTPDGEGVVKGIDCLKETVDVLFSNGDETERKTFELKNLNYKRDNNE